MPLDNEIIKTMLEIIKDDHNKMLEIIKEYCLNKEEKPIPKPVVTGNKEEKAKKNVLKPEPIPPEPKIKRKKKYISATMKRKVWDEHIGKKIGEAKCLCCKITDITQLSFHCGHVIPECNGGELILSNLKPICQNCNSSMGTLNMDDFMKSFE